VNGGLPAVENTTRLRNSSAASNNGQERTASIAQVPCEPASATILPRKKYQVKTPTESMMLTASRKVKSVILVVVQLTRSIMAQTSSR
jgi:hypothetical protein